MGSKSGLVLALCVVAQIWAKDDSKWVWGDNKKSSARDGTARYEVLEDDDYPQQRPQYGQYGQGGYGGPNTRPTFGIARPDHTPIHERPDGGVYGGNYGGNYGNGDGSYGNGGGNYGNGGGSYGSNGGGVLTGPVPSWINEGPYKNFDRCKCTEKFNCNSPGISYGHCDRGKSYCCYTTKKENQIGGPWPSKPVHSPENGVLVGPGGPHDRPFGGNQGGGGRPVGNYPRPPPIHSGPQRPQYGRPGRPSYGGSIGGGRPIHSIENGVLVGPGGPFDRPSHNNHGYGPRNAKN